MDVVNAFIHYDLDKVVYMKILPGYMKQGKVLRLRKALYRLRRSPLLWQTNLTSLLRSLSFKEVPQEPCVILNGGIIIFFYVNDIVFCYRKHKEERTRALIRELQKIYIINILGELRWFLGIHVLRDRRQRLLWLSQQAFIKKITNQYEINLTGRLPDVPMIKIKLLPSPPTLQNAGQVSVLIY